MPKEVDIVKSVAMNGGFYCLHCIICLKISDNLYSLTTSLLWLGNGWFYGNNIQKKVDDKQSVILFTEFFNNIYLLKKQSAILVILFKGRYSFQEGILLNYPF